MSRRKDRENREVFDKVKKGLASRTPSPAERAKDAERERLIQAEANRIRLEGEKIAAQLAHQEALNQEHDRLEAERRKQGK